MSRDHQKTPEEIVQSIQDTFRSNISNARVERHTAGVKKTEFVHLWMRVDRSVFKEVIKHLFTFDELVHFAVTSGYDIEDHIDLVYHFSLYHGLRNNEISLNITVSLPKTDPTIETITDLFPGALISEQEKQEMLGVHVKNIPKDQRVFIADDFPKGVYPWRRDETGPHKLIKNLHEVKQ